MGPLSANQRREFVRQEEQWLSRFLWRETALGELARGEALSTAADRADALCEAWRKRFGTKEVDPSGQPRFGSEL